MDLPIDASKAPYRAKYLDETRLLAPWFEFGSSGAGVDIADAFGDVIVRIAPDKAQRLIEARDHFLGEVAEILTED